MAKIKKTIRLDQFIFSELEKFCENENVNFSQAVNMTLAAYFSQQDKDSTPYLALMATYLNKKIENSL